MEKRPNYNSPYENLNRAILKAYRAGVLTADDVKEICSLAKLRQQGQLGRSEFRKRLFPMRGHKAEFLRRYNQECEDKFWRGCFYYDDAVRTMGWGRWNIGPFEYKYDENGATHPCAAPKPNVN